MCTAFWANEQRPPVAAADGNRPLMTCSPEPDKTAGVSKSSCQIKRLHRIMKSMSNWSVTRRRIHVVFRELFHFLFAHLSITVVKGNIYFPATGGIITQPIKHRTLFKQHHFCLYNCAFYLTVGIKLNHLVGWTVWSVLFIAWYGHGGTFGTSWGGQKLFPVLSLSPRTTFC